MAKPYQECNHGDYIAAQREKERFNNPQQSVIRGHGRGYATLFSFGVEDAAPKGTNCVVNIDMLTDNLTRLQRHLLKCC